MPCPTCEAHILSQGTPTVSHPSIYSPPGAHGAQACSVIVSSSPNPPEFVLLSPRSTHEQNEPRETSHSTCASQAQFV